MFLLLIAKATFLISVNYALVLKWKSIKMYTLCAYTA